MQKVEGFMDVHGGNVWYEIVGSKKGVPLITLHGGPGYPHDSLEPLSALANERQVIFYDQLGCGNSKRTTDTSLWTVDHFVDELGLLIKSLKIKQYHILGHSWGSALGAAFALTKPHGLQSLILTDPYLGTPQWEKDAQRLINEMPKPMQQALKKGKKDSREFKDASKEYYYRHVFRFKKFPVLCVKANNKMNHELYGYMWGPEEFAATGTLKDFDLVPRLGEITVPVLLLSGRYDEATPQALEVYQSQLPNALMKIFEKSAHFPIWTEQKTYITTIRKCLRSI